MEKETSLLAVEFWKLIRTFERSIHMLPPNHQAKTLAQLRYSASRLSGVLDSLNLKLVTFDGQPFQPNLPVTAVNADDFDDDVGECLVEQTIEPAIVKDSTVLLMGKVLLVKGSGDVSRN